MHIEQLTIGRFAEATGLSARALRLYERLGLLVPVRVDPATGYRYYQPDQIDAGRLIAALRSVAMPLTQVAEVLASPDPDRARRVVGDWWDQVERDLSDRRGQLPMLMDLIDRTELGMPTTVTLAARELAAALDRVAFAATRDDSQPDLLTHVLVTVETDQLRVLATDRHRLALTYVTARQVTGQRATGRVSRQQATSVAGRLADSNHDATVTVSAHPTQAGEDGDGLGVHARDVEDHDGMLDRIDAALAGLHTQLADGVSVLVDRSALLAAIPPDSQHGDQLRLDPQQDGLAVGHAAEATTVAAQSRPGPGTVVDAGYLREGVTAAGPGTYVQLRWAGRPEDALVVEIPDDPMFRYVLMPIRT